MKAGPDGSATPAPAPSPRSRPPSADCPRQRRARAARSARARPSRPRPRRRSVFRRCDARPRGCDRTRSTFAGPRRTSAPSGNRVRNRCRHAALRCCGRSLPCRTHSRVRGSRLRVPRARVRARSPVRPRRPRSPLSEPSPSRGRLSVNPADDRPRPPRRHHSRSARADCCCPYGLANRLPKMITDLQSARLLSRQAPPGQHLPSSFHPDPQRARLPTAARTTPRFEGSADRRLARRPPLVDDTHDDVIDAFPAHSSPYGPGAPRQRAARPRDAMPVQDMTITCRIDSPRASRSSAGLISSSVMRSESSSFTGSTPRRYIAMKRAMSREGTQEPR